MRFKKLVSFALASAMVVSLAACGETETQTQNTGTKTETKTEIVVTTNNDTYVPKGKMDQVRIGTWWVQYYASGDELEASPDWKSNIIEDTDTEVDKDKKLFNQETLTMKYNNVKKIEEKYGLKFWWENLTYTGVKESVAESIIAGSPDCEVYLTEAVMCIPAQANGFCVDLKTILPADHDLFTTQVVASYLDLGDGKACILKRNTGGEGSVADTYPLGFNLQRVLDAGLEDPRVLWERGEWTWDVFAEYMVTCQKKYEDEGVYGFMGFTKDVLLQLLMSNGATIAGITGECTIDSKPVYECLEFLQDIYQTYKVGYPYDFVKNDSSATPWESMRKGYRNGKAVFFPIACWINDDGDDYGRKADGDGSELPFDIAYVRWPVGPSGNKDTNAGKNAVGGELYIIPQGLNDPLTVFNVLYDMWNWYDGDTSLLYDKRGLNWWYETTCRKSNPELGEQNFEVMKDAGSKTTFELFDGLGIELPLEQLIDGDEGAEPQTIQQEYKQTYQDALDAYFGK